MFIENNDEDCTFDLQLTDESLMLLIYDDCIYIYVIHARLLILVSTVHVFTVTVHDVFRCFLEFWFCFYL